MDRLSEFQVFVEVVERGDYSAAARSMHMTPSAVSKAIKRLEIRLGTRLFERTSRNVHPTIDGDTLYGAAKSALEAFSEAETAVSGSLTAPGGDLRVQVPPTFAIYQLARVMPEFSRRFPAIRVSFILGNEPLDMAQNQIDATITIGRPPDSELLVRKITTSSWILCAAPRYLEQRGYPKSLDDLAHHERLGYVLDNPRNRSSQIAGLEASGTDLVATAIAANNGSMLQALARMGCGIVRLAEYHVAADIETGRLVRVLADEMREQEDVLILYPRKLRRSAKLRAFIDFLHEQISSPSWAAISRRSRRHTVANAN
jgi:DNA-binding transcriptional LysR family regulator